MRNTLSRQKYVVHSLSFFSVVKMESVFRLCVVNVESVMVLDEYIPIGKVTNIKPHFTGTFDFAGNFIIDVLFTNFNYTVVMASTFGKGGCQTSMANNETDFGVAIVDFPVDEDFEKVDPIVTLFEEPLVIVQGYNKTKQNLNVADIFQQSIMEFPVSIWLLLAFVFLVLGLLFKVRQYTHYWQPPTLLRIGRLMTWKNTAEKDENASDPFFQVWSLIMQTESKDYNDWYRKILSISLTFGSFIVITCYFCSLISTDMIVVGKPTLLESYEDIIDKKTVVPVWSASLTDYEHFRDAPEGSREQNLWTITTTQRANIDRILLKGVTDVTAHMIRGAFGETVLIVTKMLQEPIRATVCQLKGQLKLFPNVLTWSVKDPESPSYQKGMIVRKSDSKAIKLGMRRARHAIENGLIVELRRQMKDSMFVPEGFDTAKNPEYHRECASDTIVMDMPDFEPAELGNFKILGMTSMALVFLSLVVLLIEKIIKIW